MIHKMSVLPPFDEDGLLPAGDYVLTFDQLRTSMLVEGPSGSKGWARDWRRELVSNLHAMVTQLVTVGVTEVFIDGSFVEEKDIPNDIDGYFVCDRDQWKSEDLTRQLHALDPVWTWETTTREPFRGYPKPQLPMWHKYRVELFPDYGQFCGLLDGLGRRLTFPQAFRQSRFFRPKGIVKIGGLG